jgi:hypothetical protein
MQLAARPGTWAALAHDALWRASGPCEHDRPALAQEDRLEIRWPQAYSNPHAEYFIRPLLRGLRELTDVSAAPIPQPHGGLVIFEAAAGGVSHRIAIDYLDDPAVNERAAGDVALYFKYQHLKAGYGRDNVVSGGYIQPRALLYDNACRLRRLRERREVPEVYGRFSLHFATDVRRDAIERLERQDRFRYSGGGGLELYSQSIRRAARARLVLDLPGNGPFCYRLVDYLAAGCCIVAYPHDAMLPAALVDGTHLVYVRRDLSDLVDVCADLLEDEPRRRRIGAAAACFFDEQLDYRRLAGYYLRTCRERLGEGLGAARPGS